MKCLYCGNWETKESPVKKWKQTGEDVCYQCRLDWLETEYFDEKEESDPFN